MVILFFALLFAMIVSFVAMMVSNKLEDIEKFGRLACWLTFFNAMVLYFGLGS